MYYTYKLRQTKGQCLYKCVYLLVVGYNDKTIWFSYILVVGYKYKWRDRQNVNQLKQNTINKLLLSYTKINKGIPNNPINNKHGYPLYPTNKVWITQQRIYIYLGIPSVRQIQFYKVLRSWHLSKTLNSSYDLSVLNLKYLKPRVVLFYV